MRHRDASRRTSRPRRVARVAFVVLLPLLGMLALDRVADAGTVLIGDQNRGVQWKFAGSGPFGSSNSPSSPTPQPFDTTVDETDGGEGSLARVRATYASVLAAELSSVNGDLRVDRAGRPAAANAVFTFEFGVLDDPADLTLALDAAYERTAGAADPFAATGSLRVRRIPLGAPPGTVGELVLDHAFALGAADDEAETFRRGGDDPGASDALRLEPGPYALEFNIGLPEGPPDFSTWNVDDTSTDRADAVTFNVSARLISTDGGGGGTPVIPLPPAALSGGMLLAAIAASRHLRLQRLGFGTRR